MQEDIRENFVLLSKIAKEKKYAQEYMGLLARRGDIGSIRIGKRWYTTWQWFEEFLGNSQKKSSFAKAPSAAEALAGKLADKKEVVSEVQIAEPAKIAVAVKMRKVEIRKNFAGDIREIKEIGKSRRIKMYPVKAQNQNFIHETRLGNISVAERNKHAVPYPEIKFRKKTDVFSPDLFREENMRAPIFPKFVFAFSFAIVLLLVAASGYFVWFGGLLRSGQVAGASDERNGGFPGIKSGSEYILVSAGDKIKQSLSISKLIVQAAKEKSTNNEQ